MCDELLKAIAQWLVAAGYGVDMNFEKPPPVALRSFLVQAWYERDGSGLHTPDDYAWLLNSEAGKEWYS